MPTREAAVTDAPPTVVLHSGPLRAEVLPRLGMLIASLRHHGRELLRGVDDIAQAIRDDALVGIPLLHPWANRLASGHYETEGRQVTLPPRSPWLRYDDNGLPNHGVSWSKLPWTVTAQSQREVRAVLQWNRADWLALFPFPHRLEMAVSLDDERLRVDTMLHADDTPVPVCFGFHPYLGIPGVPRDRWRLRTPPMRRLVLDRRRLPTGASRPFPGFDTPLAELDLDHAFALDAARATILLGAGGRELRVELLEGYRFVQFYAPRGRAFLCPEPMTAPANALVSGRDLPRATRDAPYRAAFAIRWT